GRVRAMRCGADVCLPRDTPLEELVAALNVVGRRVGVSSAPLVLSDLAGTGQDPPLADPAQGVSVPDGKWSLQSQGWVLVNPRGLRLSLTTSERDLMLLLLREPGGKVAREELIRACAGA